MSEELISIKKDISFSDSSGYVFTNKESGDNYFYFNIDPLISFNGINLNSLKNAVANLPEILNSSSPIKHNNIQFE
jgi:hypothetical protein